MSAAAGLILGPIFPTLIAILLTNVEAPLHGRAVGVFFAVGGIGWTTVPMLIGYCAKRSSVQRTFLVATGCAVLLMTLSVALYYQPGQGALRSGIVPDTTSRSLTRHSDVTVD